LDNVSGHAKPGELMAILGPPGAGKTTLLNVLAGKIPNSALKSGSVFVNGEPRNKRAKRHTAFVLQDDIFFSSLTVRETLTLTGQLLLPSTMSEEQKLQRVEDIIELLKLTKVANSKVGDAMIRGLSGGEKKRLNIANELITDPSLLILDEPTSGLDSYLADEVDGDPQRDSIFGDCGHGPLRYLYDALMINEFQANAVFSGDDDDAAGLCPPTSITGIEVIDQYGPIIWGGCWASVWLNILVILAMVCAYRILGQYFLHKRTKQ
jgi:ABC-type lipoprotein export system ATPase subunit